MRVSSLLQTATLALSLTAATGAVTAAFADSASATSASAAYQQQQALYAGPYDGPDFVVPMNDLP